MKFRPQQSLLTWEQGTGLTCQPQQFSKSAFGTCVSGAAAGCLQVPFHFPGII